MNDTVTGKATATGGKFALNDQAAFWNAVKAREFGDGEELVVMVMTPEEAARHGHHKHLHGFLLTPVSNYTGEPVTELKNEMKALYLPDGMTSTTEMSAAQFEEFNRAVEHHWIHKLPEAFAEIDRN